MGFTEILTIVFIVLKLTGVIAWSWWLVLLPELIAVAGYIVVLLLYLAATRSARRAIRDIMRDL